VKRVLVFLTVGVYTSPTARKILGKYYIRSDSEVQVNLFFVFNHL